jgi:hypothetical protein
MRRATAATVRPAEIGGNPPPSSASKLPEGSGASAAMVPIVEVAPSTATETVRFRG